MPGFEVIGKEEQEALNQIFERDNGILFAHGFDALRNNRFRVREFETQFAAKFGARYCQAVTSGSTALLVALKALGVGPGDEVITQSFTFVATVEAILMLGARPVITEIDQTFNMDPEDLRSKITSKTKVIVPVHMAGVPANMREIMRIAQEAAVPILEDTAQGIGASVDGKACGTIGTAGAFSLDFGKTITSGEGGMILTSEESVYREALAFHDHGHEYNPDVGRADDTRHTWGLNFRMSEMNAAVGSVQLEKLDYLLERARANKGSIKSAVASNVDSVQFRRIPAGGIESADSLYLIFPDQDRTREVLNALKAAGLGTKNVPDAIKWHFAGQWEHMYSYFSSDSQPIEQAWPRSRDLLLRSVALPVMVKWDEPFIEAYLEKLIPALRTGE